MANKYALNEGTPANTDDALEGPLRIREIKQAYNERIGRDHLIGNVTSPDVIAQGADSGDSGYHRRLTIREETIDQATNADNRLNASSTGINHGTTAKMAEVWVEKSSATGDETSIRFIGTEGTGNEQTVVTLAQTQTLTNKTLTKPILNDATLSGGDGSIDGVAIGQRAADPDATPTPVLAGAAAGKFTTLESTGDTVIGDADTDTLTLKAATNGLSSDAGGTTGANKFYAGLAGEIKMFAGSSLPAGWLWCDGAEYIKTDYAELYTAIGDIYNATANSTSSSLYGNYISNSSYFRVPDLRGRAPVGTGQGYDSSDSSITGVDVGGDESTDVTTKLTTRTLGQYGGGEEHTLSADESGAGPHYHPVNLDDPGHKHSLGEDVANNVEPSGWRYNSHQYRKDSATDRYSENNTTGLIAKANAVLDTEEETEAEAITRTGTVAETDPTVSVENVFRRNKSNLNRAVPAASGHTQMQPFVVINFIIKY